MGLGVRVRGAGLELELVYVSRGCAAAGPRGQMRAGAEGSWVDSRCKGQVGEMVVRGRGGSGAWMRDVY